jgi:uncharacterized membrane protein YccC
MLSYIAWHLAADGLRACGETVPDVDAYEAPAPPEGAMIAPLAAATAAAEAAAVATRDAVEASGRLAAAYASTRSVWFRNSLRGAVGLALAVWIGQVADLQHGFWVVLGMVSVLRSRALSTGSTLVQALAGTFVGIVAGGAIVTLIDGDRTLLWIALPLAVMLATYAPRAISFVAGQAAFSCCVLILFNLIEPVGWSVGIVRIEDVAIGGAISLAAGLLLWPRGASAVVRRALADAYASSAAALSATVATLLHGGPPDAPEPAFATAVADARRLDDAFRQYLAEPGRRRDQFAQTSRLIAGSGRVRRAAHSLRDTRALLPLTALQEHPAPALAHHRALLERELEELRRWLDELAAAIASGAAPPALQQPAAGAEDAARLLRPHHGAPLAATATIAWAREHIVMLRRLEPPLAEAAAALPRDGAMPPARPATR